MAAFSLLPSAAREDGSGTVAIPTSGEPRLVTVYISVTAEDGTSTLDAKIEQQDPASGVWFEVGAFTQITAVGVAKLTVGAAEALGAPLRLNWTVGGTGMTFSAGAVVARNR